MQNKCHLEHEVVHASRYMYICIGQQKIIVEGTTHVNFVILQAFAVTLVNEKLKPMVPPNACKSIDSTQQ